MLQGVIAGNNMAHIPSIPQKEYPGAIPIVSSAFFGIKYAACGPVINPPDIYYAEHQHRPDGYRLLVREKNTDILKGFVLIGSTNTLIDLRRALLTQSPYI